jgi:hypothetical protein
MVRTSIMSGQCGAGLARRLLGLAALLLASCTEEPGLLPLDSRVVLRLAEDEAGFQVNATTEKDYPCVGHAIVARRSRNGSLFEIAFVGVRPPRGPCGHPVSPASQRVRLGELEAGYYLLGLAAPGRTSRASLRVTADSILVMAGESTWITWPDRGYIRRPSGSTGS